MGLSSERGVPLPEDLASSAETDKGRGSPLALRRASEFWLNRYCRSFEVEGQENLAAIRQQRKENPDSRFVVASSHFSDLDGPSAVKVFGKDLDLLVGASSTLFKRLAPEREILFRIAGVESFAPIKHKKRKDGTQGGIFNPDDFDAMASQMDQGKTPWLSIHEFTREDQMRQAGIGAVYLAQQSQARIIPSALEFRGTNPKLGDVIGLAKGIINKSEIIYHVGQPVELEPIDVGPIRKVIENRRAKIRSTSDEISAFRETRLKLKAQAEQIALIIASMLPEEQRGEYRGKVKS